MFRRIPTLPQKQGCASLIVNFQPQYTSSILWFHWDIRDASTVANTSLLAIPSYTFINLGTYIVQLIVSGSVTGTTEMQIIVVDPPFYQLQMILTFTKELVPLFLYLVQLANIGLLLLV